MPPQGYGAIQWVCAHLIRGLRALGHEVTLLGAPGSPMLPDVRVLDATTPAHFDTWAARTDVDIARTAPFSGGKRTTTCFYSAASK